jgi:hypothetical protein
MTDPELNELRRKWDADQTRWRWAFTIAVTIGVAIAGQMGTTLWWASDINTRVATVERRSDAHRNELSQIVASAHADRVLAARQEQKLEEALRILRVLESRDRQEGRP